jgi:hypothetical protein
MFDIVGASDAAWFTVASKDEILEGTRKVAIEAIRSQPSPSRGPRFARNNYSMKTLEGAVCNVRAILMVSEVNFNGFRLCCDLACMVLRTP